MIFHTDKQSRRGYAGRLASRTIRILGLLLVVSGGTACTAPAAQKPADRASQLQADRREGVVAALDAQLPEVLRQLARQRANRLSVDAILEAPEDTLPGVELRQVDYLRRLYAQRDFEPVWVEVDRTSAHLTNAAKELHAALQKGADEHGLWPDELHLRRLEDIALPPARATGEAFDGVSLTLSEREAVLAWLGEQQRTWGADGELDELADQLVADGQPLQRFRAPVDEQVSRLTDVARQSSRVDVVFSDALVQYAMRMRFDNPAWQKGQQWPEKLQKSSELAGKALEDARRDYLVMQRLGPVFDQPSRVGRVMAEIVPPFEPYRRLTHSFVRYAEIVRDGGWPRIPDGAEGLKRGSTSKYIPIVKKRLRIEGYYDGDDSKEFGNDLRRALLTYQHTHQLWENGWLTPQTMSSLNETATDRWNQIRLTLQRWRESRVGPDKHYVQVNLPDFHAAVWRDGQRDLYFKVIVGQTTREKNDDGKLVYKHATPRFSDTLEYIVFNPYWNVPENIREKELEPKFAENPAYLDEKRYQYYTDTNGHQFLRQLPGPQNALGRVKFLFPNNHSVYMHDTPDKYLFKHPFRAYSHGCIRVQNPMKFANYLLDLDGRWKDRERTEDKDERQEKLDEWFAKDGETWVNLRKNLPVHIEYYVVRVDDEGHANFLADLYRLDKPRLEKVAQKVAELGLAEPSQATASNKTSSK